MIEWYNDDEVAIYFDKTPEVRIRYIMPYMLEEEIEDIYEKPFISESKLNVVLVDKILQEKYKFEIPEFYTWDGATIPRVFWRLIGAKTDNKFLIPSLVHDVLCENHDYINGDRYFSTIVFERLLYVSKVNAFSRWMIKHSVDNFQKVAGKWKD